MGLKGYYEGIRESENKVNAGLGTLATWETGLRESRAHLDAAIGDLDPPPADLAAARDLSDKFIADTELARTKLLAYLAETATIQPPQ